MIGITLVLHLFFKYCSWNLFEPNWSKRANSLESNNFLLTVRFVNNNTNKCGKCLRNRLHRYKAVQIVFFSLDFQNWTFDFELKPLFINIINLLSNWRKTKRETIDGQNENDFYFSEFNTKSEETQSRPYRCCWQYHHSECWCLFVMIKLFKFMERFEFIWFDSIKNQLNWKIHRTWSSLSTNEGFSSIFASCAWITHWIMNILICHLFVIWSYNSWFT